MFGCLAAGRLVQTGAQQVDETHCVFNIDNAASVNHIVVFLTGTMPFPEGMGGAVYFSWPSPEGNVTLQYLGYLCNEKPSAIFKVSGFTQGTTSTSNPFQGFGMTQPHATTAQIGIAIEALSQIIQQSPAEKTKASNLDSFSEFTMKMLQNFYNFATSFAQTQSQMTPQPNVSFVPLSTLDTWLQGIQRKMSQDPNFWRK